MFHACLKPGDTILGFDLAHGGHLTHGSPVNFSGKIYNPVFYGVEKQTGMLDYDKIEAIAIKYRIHMAWAMMMLAIVLGVYTGILLSAFNARPLWNTSILGPLFLVSGLSTGLAAIMWMSKSQYERTVLSKIDIALIAVELFLIIHLFMGFLAATEVQIEAANLFLGGEFTTSFWVFVVILGLILPATLEILELRGYKIPIWIPAALILFGGLAFRFIMVEAGQITRYLY